MRTRLTTSAKWQEKKLYRVLTGHARAIQVIIRSSPRTKLKDFSKFRLSPYWLLCAFQSCSAASSNSCRQTCASKRIAHAASATGLQWSLSLSATLSAPSHPEDPILNPRSDLRSRPVRLGVVVVEDHPAEPERRRRLGRVADDDPGAPAALAGAAQSRPGDLPVRVAVAALDPDVQLGPEGSDLGGEALDRVALQRGTPAISVFVAFRAAPDAGDRKCQ